MQGMHQVVERGAPWAGSVALPGRVAVAFIAGLSAALWAAVVRVVAWLAAGV